MGEKINSLLRNGFVKPQNFQELTIAAQGEVQEKVYELMERIDELAKMGTRLDELDTQAFHLDAVLEALIGPADDYGDLADLRRVQEMITNWPEVTTAPGRGYW